MWTLSTSGYRQTLSDLDCSHSSSQRDADASFDARGRVFLVGSDRNDLRLLALNHSDQPPDDAPARSTSAKCICVSLATAVFGARDAPPCRRAHGVVVTHVRNALSEPLRRSLRRLGNLRMVPLLDEERGFGQAAPLRAKSRPSEAISGPRSTSRDQSIVQFERILERCPRSRERLGSRGGGFGDLPLSHSC
jgi:hypothetical protein